MDVPCGLITTTLLGSIINIHITLNKTAHKMCFHLIIEIS